MDNGSGGKGRIPAIASVVDISIAVDPANAPLTIDATTVIVLQMGDGPFYISAQSTPVTLNSGNGYTHLIRFQARIPGLAGESSFSSGAKFVQAPAGVDGGVDPHVIITAARDQETSEAYIARALGKWGTLGAGWNRAAFDYLIPTLAPSVTRWYVDDLLPNGAVTVYLANASGPATVQEIADVDTGLGADDVKALGSGTLTVQAASAVVLTITATVTSDGTNADLADDLEANFATLDGAFIIGPATLELDLIRSILMGAGYGSISVATTGGAFRTITVTIPAVPGAVGIVSLNISSDQTITLGQVLQISATVTAA
jgi:hypothetical protein